MTCNHWSVWNNIDSTLGTRKTKLCFIYVSQISTLNCFYQWHNHTLLYFGRKTRDCLICQQACSSVFSKKTLIHWWFSLSPSLPLSPYTTFSCWPKQKDRDRNRPKSLCENSVNIQKHPLWEGKLCVPIFGETFFGKKTRKILFFLR